VREREQRFSEQRVTAVQSEWDDVAQYIDEAVAALKPGLRDVVVMHFLQGRQQEEVARALGIAPRTVRYRQQRAIETIRRDLRRRGIAVKTGLAALLAANLAGAAEAALLPESLRTGLGRIALSGIVPSPRLTLTGTLVHTTPWKALGTAVAVAGVLALCTVLYFAQVGKRATVQEPGSMTTRIRPSVHRRLTRGRKTA